LPSSVRIAFMEWREVVALALVAAAVRRSHIE
jgi:hypothetical protein